ncbi:MAG: hypothetical protein QOJ19_2178 [Acidimicrobiia bacterium]|nr:hypothetical protein [Acidimicrobiia bacterium]
MSDLIPSRAGGMGPDTTAQGRQRPIRVQPSGGLAGWRVSLLWVQARRGRRRAVRAAADAGQLTRGCGDVRQPVKTQRQPPERAAL